MRSALIALAALLAAAAPAQQPPAPLRPPAIPLALHDPYFSLWATADSLTASPTRHWTGVPQPLNGLIRVDGATYRLLGADRAAPALRQASLRITPTRTIAVLDDPAAAPAFEVTLTFLNPALPGDLAQLSRPVTYLSWSVRSLD